MANKSSLYEAIFRGEAVPSDGLTAQQVLLLADLCRFLEHGEERTFNVSQPEAFADALEMLYAANKATKGSVFFWQLGYRHPHKVGPRGGASEREESLYSGFPPAIKNQHEKH